MKIAMLLENNKIDKTYKNEHGLSIYIEFGEHKILFDTGPSNTYLKNAAKMGVNVAEIDTIIISHGHSDHIAGLPFFPNNKQLQRVIMSQNIHTPFWIKAGPKFVNVGIKQQQFEHLQQKILYVDKMFTLTENIKIIGLGNQQAHSGNLYMGERSNRQLDTFSHEIFLIIEQNNELVVFTGCSHNGIINIMNAITEEFPMKKIKAVIGGFHLIKLPYLNNLNTSKQNVLTLAKALKTYHVETYYSCHCTGKKGMKIMRTVLGNRLEEFPTGKILEI